MIQACCAAGSCELRPRVCFPALDCGGDERFPPPFQAHCLMMQLSLEQGCGLESLIYPGGSKVHRSDAPTHLTDQCLAIKHCENEVKWACKVSS